MAAFTKGGLSRITSPVDHVTDGGTPGSTALCELTRDFRPFLPPMCVAEDLRSRGTPFLL